MPSSNQIPSYVRLAIAGLAGGGSALVSHPFDLVKYRMQVSGKGGTQRMYKTSLHAVYDIATREGYMAVYNGFSAGVLRQLTLTTIRMGMYSVIVDKYAETDGTPPSIYVQLGAGLMSGAAGAIVGNPCDVALVRMALDGGLPPKDRFNYRHVFNALNRIVKEEGVKSLWLGWKPTALRSMVLNLTQLVLYKNTKVFLMNTGFFGDSTILHAICGIWTALMSSIATAPIDITKTRIQNTKNVGKPEYTNMINAWAKIIRYEGIFALWKGLTPTFGRILPNNFVVFILLEQLTKTYKSLVLGDDSGTGF